MVPDLTEASLTLSQRQFGPSSGGPINLRQANLEGAVLRYATLSGADLEGAILAGADLVHARLDGANLAGSDLTDAVCEHVDFAGANLDRALLTGASFANVRNLTEEQIALAHGDATTLLPIAIMPPSNWFPELDEGVFPDYPVPDRFREEDAYTILGVERDASAADIRGAFRNLVKKFHPDLNPDDEEAQESFKQVSTAYRILSDPDKRSRYDKGEIGSDGEINPEYEARRQFRRYAYRFYAAAALSLFLAAGVLGIVWHAVLTEDPGRGRVELAVAKAPKSSERLGAEQPDHGMLASPDRGMLQVDAARRAKLGMMETGDQDEESEGETLSKLARIEDPRTPQAEPVVPGAALSPTPAAPASSEAAAAAGASQARGSAEGTAPVEMAKADASPPAETAKTDNPAPAETAKTDTSVPAEMAKADPSEPSAPAADSAAVEAPSREAAAPSQPPAEITPKTEVAVAGDASAEASAQSAKAAVPNPPAEPPASPEAAPQQPQTQIAAANPQPEAPATSEAAAPEVSSATAGQTAPWQEFEPAGAAPASEAPAVAESAATPPGQAAPQPPAVSDKPAIAAVSQEQGNSARPLGEDHKGQEARPAQADAARASTPAQKPEGFLTDRPVASADQPKSFFGTRSLRKGVGWKGPRDDISSMFRHRAVRQAVARDPSQATASMEPSATHEGLGGQEEVWDVYTHSLPAAEEDPAPSTAWKALAPNKAVASSEVPAPRPDDVAPPSRLFQKQRPPVAANRKQAVSDILAGGL